MNDIIFYFNLNPQIKNALFVVGPDAEENALTKFISSTRLEKLVVAGDISKRKINEIIINIKEKSIGKFNVPNFFEFQESPETLGNDFALVFYDLENISTLLKYAGLKPKHLLGTVLENISSFEIWKNFRNSAKHIRIKTLRAGKAPQMLSWDFRAESNVELSVVFPMYKVEKYLDECIESVIKSTGDYIEFLFVNDGSPDNCRQIVLDWAKKDSRIKLIDKENGGCASARQKGLDNARGRYVGFVDPDDFVAPEMFNKLLSAAMIGSYEISFSGYNEFYETTITFKPAIDTIGYPYCDGIQSSNNRTGILSAICYCRVAIWRGIYSIEMLKRANIHFYTDIKRYDDLPFKVETFANAKSIISVPEYLYFYRLARPGQDVSLTDERLFVHFDIFKHLNDSILSKKDQEITDCLNYCKAQTHRWIISKIDKNLLKKYVKSARNDLKSSVTNWKSTEKFIKNKGGKKLLKFLKALKINSAFLSRKRSKF